MVSSLPYREPSIITVLIQSSFLLSLNGINHILDSAIYAGLVGQILVGVAWGIPGGGILDLDAQEVIVQLGYIGLILLVFEGGLSTSFPALKANLFRSALVAITGVACPIGLSFVLLPLAEASPLQAFAAGAALCATSLGTTITLLGNSGLRSTRLGVVLISAATMDDVIGLIMVQIISSLGSSSSFHATTVIRPVFVSLAFAVLLPLFCHYFVLPASKRLAKTRESKLGSLMYSVFRQELTALTIHTGILIAAVTGATYGGSSGLLGAYIAGTMISWWDTAVSHPEPLQQPDNRLEIQQHQTEDDRLEGEGATAEPWDGRVPLDEVVSPNDSLQPCSSGHTGSDIFHKYYQPVLQRIFKPLFFASVGFSIPISQMFSGPIVWRGLVYTVLMIFGKLFCGLWLIRLPKPSVDLRLYVRKVINRLIADKSSGASGQPKAGNPPGTPEPPRSLYPGLILGSAMVARGEIGYLISSLAETGGVFSNNISHRSASGEPSEIFLIATWAITLCTLTGPIAMGLLVNWLGKLERRASERSGHGDRPSVLGVWGLI